MEINYRGYSCETYPTNVVNPAGHYINYINAKLAQKQFNIMTYKQFMIYCIDTFRLFGLADWNLYVYSSDENKYYQLSAADTDNLLATEYLEYFVISNNRHVYHFNTIWC